MILLIYLLVQIRAELVYHNIVLYPFDTDENDEEELRLNESIRVSYSNTCTLIRYTQTCICRT